MKLTLTAKTAGIAAARVNATLAKIGIMPAAPIASAPSPVAPDACVLETAVQKLTWRKSYDTGAYNLSTRMIGPWPCVVPRKIPVTGAPPVDSIRPLAIGFREQLIARTDGSAAATEAVDALLRLWDRCRVYQTAMQRPDAMRHDIDGNPVEPPKASHRPPRAKPD